MESIKIALLKKNIDLIKQEMFENDFNDPKSMINLCSYLAIKVGEKIHEMGNDSYTVLHMHIPDEKLDNSSPLKKNANTNHNHNVILFDNKIIDLTRKQFGNLIPEDVMKKEDYLDLGWIVRNESVFKNDKKKTYYHGTNKSFENLEITKKGTISTVLGSENIHREGLFFTSDIDFAKEFGSIIHEVNLDIKKTLDLRNGFTEELVSEFKDKFRENWMELLLPVNIWEIFDGDEAKYISDSIQEKGYDSVLIKEESEKGLSESIIIFDINLVQKVEQKNKNTAKIKRKHL